MHTNEELYRLIVDHKHNGLDQTKVLDDISVTVTDADIIMQDITTNNVTSAKHGFAPKSPADATKFLNGAATPDYALVKDSDLSTSDITTNNATSSKHGFLPKLSNSATDFLDGTGAFDSVKDSDLSTSDITTNNATSSKHGFLPKLSNVSTEFLNGTGAFSTPATTSLRYSVNVDETVTDWFTWTVPILFVDDGGNEIPVSWLSTGLGTAIDDRYRGAAGLTELTASGPYYLYSGLAGNGSNETYTAASSKDLRWKWRIKCASQAAGDILGFGIVDANTTFDDAQTSVAAGVRFVNSGGNLYAQVADGAAETDSGISAGITLTNWNVYEIVFNPGVDAKFYVNGVLKATLDTNLPTGSLQYIGIGYFKNTNNITMYVSPLTIGLEM